MAQADKWLRYSSDDVYPVEGPTLWRHQYINDLDGMKYPDAFGYRVEPENPDHFFIIERCIDYFHRLNSLGDLKLRRKNDLWGTVIETKYDEFEDALLTRNAGRVSHMLLNVADTPLRTGFINAVHPDDPRNGGNAHLAALNVVDTLIALANAFGYPVVNAEQGAMSFAHIAITDLLDYISAPNPFISSEIPLIPPKAGGQTFGLCTVNGILTQRDLIAIYIASRIDGILGHNRNVCEIGGGSGTQTYYLAQMGMSVSLFDLPIVSVLQSYFLMTSLGREKVWIFGEDPEPSAQVRILPWWELPNAGDEEFALVLNVDSLPEIELETAREYIKLIFRKSQVFFSVNQEAGAVNTPTTDQQIVWRLVAEHGGVRRSLRSPFWLRAGYVEEVFEKKT